MNPGTVGLDHYRRLFVRPARRHGQLDRNSLPSPVRYLTEQGLLTGKPRSDWALVRCPSHKGGDERKPSLGISLVDGHFRCHACGVKGGDVIALHMLITGKRFPEAVADLGGRFDD
jgi:hypothetical protein